jgi:KipI family sensor histidine kinase inhibitor
VSEAPTRRIEPIGERAVLVTVGDRVDLVVNDRARRLAAAVEAYRASDPRLGRSVPAAASVLVPFDPMSLSWPEAAGIVAELADRIAAAERGPDGADAEGADTAAARSPVEIEVRYGNLDGPDLAAVAAGHGLRPADIVELHAGSVWTVLFLGFAPGFAYLGPLPPELATARLSTPRERVPAGSVAIGGDQTAVYPFAMPGGWQIIGRTDRTMWDLGRVPPNLLGTGGRVRFVPVR